MPPQNSVWLYRNGIADFRRGYTVPKEGCSISIPVKESYVGDVLASIDYFGKVRITKPPSFPSKSNDSKLRIEADDPLGSALTQFSGARVRLNLKLPLGSYVDGTLAGVESCEEKTPSGGVINVRCIHLVNDDGLRSFDLKADIKSVFWLDDADRAEFVKALARNYQKIKPGSTFIDLALEPSSGDVETDVIIQYALPVASWNMSYRLRRDEAGAFTLDGHAVVHNSTDFDWNGYKVSVVTGEPTTFSHDLAEAKVPTRNRVNVTSERAYGAVNCDESTAYGAVNCPINVKPVAGRIQSCSTTASYSSTFSAPTQGAASAQGAQGAQGVGGSYDRAELDMADAETVGDYLILTSPNAADIPANQSALVPMFSKPLPAAERVFYYNPNNDENFPFSAVKFLNTTGMPLTKGVVTVVIEGHNAGEAVLEQAKPGDTRLVAHSVESGIRVTRERGEYKNDVTSCRISDGLVVTEMTTQCGTNYTVKNKLDEVASLLVEHNQVITQSDFVTTYQGKELDKFEKIGGGLRFTINVPAKATVTFSVNERKVNAQEARFDNGQFSWLSNQDFFRGNAQFTVAAKITDEIADIQRQIAEQNARKVELLAEQARANGFLSNATGQNRDRWEEAIAKAEDEIQLIQKTHVPTLQEKTKAAQRRLSDALKEIRTVWVVGRIAKAAA